MILSILRCLNIPCKYVEAIVGPKHGHIVFDIYFNNKWTLYDAQFHKNGPYVEKLIDKNNYYLHT